MVQLYNPNVTGKQVLINTKNIDSTKLKLIENVHCTTANGKNNTTIKFKCGSKMLTSIWKR